MQRGQRPLGVLPRQIGYPLSFRGQVIGTQSSLPCFPQWFYARGSSLSSGGSRRAQFPAFIGTMKPLRRPATLAPQLMSSPRGSVWARLFRVRRCAPDEGRAQRQAGSFVHPALHCSGSLQTGVIGTSQVPWRPILCLCPALRPRPNRSILAIAACPMLPPDPTRRRLRIPTKPATHSNRKPATDSDLKPAGVPI